MSKFKAGDLVICARPRDNDMHSVLTVGETYTVAHDYTGLYLKLDGWAGYTFEVDRFDLASNQEREEVEKAIAIFEKHNIRRVSTGEYIVGRFGGDFRTYDTVKLLDYLCSPADPHKEEREAIEKEMRELAEKQEQLASRVAELGGAE